MKPHQAWIMASFGRVLKEKDAQAKAEMCFNKSLTLWKEMGKSGAGKIDGKRTKSLPET